MGSNSAIPIKNSTGDHSAFNKDDSGLQLFPSCCIPFAKCIYGDKKVACPKGSYMSKRRPLYLAEVVIAYDRLCLLDSFECMSRQLGPIGQAKARNGL